MIILFAYAMTGGPASSFEAEQAKQSQYFPLAVLNFVLVHEKCGKVLLSKFLITGLDIFVRIHAVCTL